MKVEFTPANCCPLCRPNNHPNPRYKGCLTPSAAEGKLFALSLKVYLAYVEKYTKSTVSHIFVMSASVTNCITDDKSDLCTSYSNLSLSSDIRSVVATSPRLDAAFHTKYLTIIGCGNAKTLGVTTGMLSGFVAVQHAAAIAAAAGKPDDIQLHKKLYDVLSNVPGTTIPATYDLAVEMMNDKGFGAAELKRAREKHGRWLGKTYGKVNGKLCNKDFYDSQKKAEFERLKKEDPNCDQEEAEQMAHTCASKREQKRKEVWSANGRNLGNTYGKVNGKLCKADFYDSDKKTELERLTKEDPNRDQEEAEQMAHTHASKREQERKEVWSANGKVNGKLCNKDYYESDLKTKLERLTKEDPNRDQEEAEQMAHTHASKREQERKEVWSANGKVNGKLCNKDYYESDLKTKLERLTKEDPNRDQKEAEKMALTYASKRVEERLVAKGKPRAQKRKLEGEEKALWAKRNANNKAVRNAQNKQCWLCNTCNYSCQHGNKSRDMPNHLNKNPKCRVSKENYISNFSKDGWQ